MATIPEHFAQLFDDAALFPPGNAPLDRAVADHRDHRAGELSDLIGPFVVSDLLLPELTRLLEASDAEEELPIALVVTGGAGAIEGAVTWAHRSAAVDLRAVEFALRDEADLAHNARRVVTMLDTLEEQLDEATVFVEPPRLHDAPSAGWLAALDELAARELPLKFRTGGVEADMVPTPAQLAAAIDAALDRELPFKCTAGLHHAIRHDEGHGFLNVWAATRATLDGDSAEEVLESTDVDAILARVDASGRRWFRSFGTCSILEPHEDLVDLGLIGVGA